MSSKLRVGTLCFVKESIWKDYCIRSQGFYEGLKPQIKQPVVAIGEGFLNGYAMLAFPFWWWKIEELEWDTTD